MPIKLPQSSPPKFLLQRGLTLIETIVFMVVVGVALTVVVQVHSQAVRSSVDPAMRIKALQKSQGLMDRILARRFDENTPTGGIPACDSTDGIACAGISVDTDYDDVGDYNGFTDTSEAGYEISVSIVVAGSELGIANALARRVTIQTSMPDGNSVTLSAYKVNF